MKTLLTVALTAGCFYFASTYSAFAQVQASQGIEVLRTESTTESYMLSKPKAPEMPALQQLQQQTGVFVERQSAQDAKPVKGDPTNKAALEQLAVRFQNDYNAAQVSLIKKGASISGARMVSGHTVVQYKKVTGNEAPLFYVTSNLQGAHTISTSKVWPGGLAGLNLAGQGMDLGEWDGGAVRTTHQEFGTRVTVMDASPNIDAHATHVAATIIGAGTDPLAKGMAYQASLRSYDWTNDEAEMATAAAAGMLVSNHSYGLITGWYFGDFEGTGSQWYWLGANTLGEDHNYGRYSAQARDWDLIASNAANYLIVKAAGNDRNYGPAPGTTHRAWNGSNWVNSTITREKAGGVDGYDCISHAGVAKNVLTVGAVEGITGGYSAASQVISSAFHGWGPTDDGRIKPDLVAKGVAVYSATATSNTSYDSWNGTSMASPTVTGSLALLQQYHKQLYNNTVLKAATLKGIAIHTADEAGDFPGPDYRFGWGLMNTEKATQVIARLAQKHDFKEEVLANGAVNTYAIRSDGTSPLRVTLSWTDVAAAIAPAVLNGNTSALVNNLDVRLIRVSDSAVFSPWVLNPAVPAAAATTGDNNRDNLEQVFLANPGAGDYIVRVSHKGTLGASQAFSLVMSGIVPLNVLRNITFRVDMTGLTVSSSGVRIAGNVFNPPWDPSANLMTNVGNGIWSFTTSILSGTNVQYKFINGNAWGQDENALPAGCNTGGNRTYTVPNNDDVLPAFLFNQCNAGGGQMVSVTFNVDMTGQTIRPEGMHVAGNFQGWNPAGTPMTLHPTLPNVYTHTTQILEGTDVEYKYINGNSWGFFDTITNQFVNYSEQTPFSCSRFSNRFFTVPNSAITLPAFLFGRCNTTAQTPLLVDFAGGIPAGWTQQGFSGSALTPNSSAIFEYRGPGTSPTSDTGSRGGYSGLRLPILSPTAANGFLIFDSDFLDNAGVVGAFGTGTAPAPHMARLTSPALNLSSVTAPVLRFNQFYRKFAGAPGYTTATFVVVSTDGGVTWPDTIQFNTGNVLAQNSATLRNNQQQLFLPSLGGQSNVKIQFLFWGDYYFWMLDDIVLEQSLSNDLALLDASIFNSNAGLVNTYGMVPLFQQQPATFSSVIQNVGATAVPQPGVVVNMFRDSVNVYTESAFSINNLGFGASTQINLTNPPFVASQTGTYRANFSLLNNTGDSNPGNNQLDRHYFITDTVYALDHGPFGNYVTVGTNNFISSGSRDGMRFANRFSVTGQGMQVSSAFLGVASNSTPGATITFGLINAADLLNPTALPIATTNTVVLTAQHIAAGGVTVSFPGGQFLAPGEYYLGAETYTNAGASVVNVLDDISRPRAGDASMIYLPTPALWYSNGIAFVLRLHGTASGSYCTSSAGSVFDTKIDSVVLGAFATGSHPDSCEAYTNYTGLGLAATLEKGVGFPINIKIGTCNDFYSAKGRVFVDLNQDFNFTADEALYNFELNTSGSVANPWYNGMLQVPLTALTGPTRMRIVYKEGATSFADVNSCGPYNWGETEDYTVQIVPNSGTGSFFTDAVRSRGTTTAVVAGEIGQVTNLATKGVVYGTSPMPTLTNNSVIDVVPGNRVVTNLNNLMPNTQYFARVYVTDGAGTTTYANEISFRTFDVPGSQLVSPTFAVTAPAVVAGPYAYGFGASGWNYVIDTLSVDAPMVVGRAVQSDSLGCGGGLFVNADDVRGKIAVLYRGSCDFGLKALSAQNAGAVGVVIINNQPGIINLAGGANGANVTIPVYLISAADGALLRQHIDQGAARAILGNKVGTFGLDLALESGDLIKPRAVAIPNELVNQPGDQVLQLGSFVRNLGATPVNYMLSIEVWQNGSPNSVVFSQSATSTVPLAPGTMAKLMLPAMPGFHLSALGIGRHKIRYQVTPTTGIDASNGDNVVFQDLDITQDVYSATRLDSGGNLIITGANRPALSGGYTVGNWFSANTAGRMQVNQLKFAFNATAPADLTGQFIEGSIYKWDDLNANGAIDSSEMLLVGTGSYTYPDNGVFQTRVMNVSSTSNPNAGVPLINGARYLFAVSYSGSAFEVYACTDGASNYTATADHTGFPISAVLNANGDWSVNGFGPATVFAIAAVMSPAQQQSFGTVTGQVRYANNAQTPMSNTWVVAYDAVDNTVRDAVQTDANGQYFFSSAPQGSYILRAATTKPWGGVNATDALRVARHFTSLQPLAGIRLEAADVNGNAVINSTDALQIAQRFTGLLNNPNFLRIYFDALLGGNLAAVSSVHMHSGASVDPNFSWQYVVGNWGNPTSPGQMTSGGNGRWSLAMNPTTYYNQAPNGPMPAGSSIDNIGLVFRESGPCGTNVPCLTQKDGQGNDIFLYPWLNPPVSSYLGVKATMSSANGFGGGNWMFSEALVQVVANQNTTADLQAICMGDVDGSYNPGNVRIAPSVHLENDGELVTSTGKLVKMPIRIETGTLLGAMSLVMQYNPSQMQPVALKLTDAQRQAQAQVKITEGNISLAWYDLSGWVVTNDQVIMELEAYVFTESVDQIELAVGEGSEFADESATPLNNTKLLMPGIRSTSSSVTNVLSLSNYPNPFRHETTVAFELPEAGKVKMIVNDVTGRLITELDLGELTAGKHTQLFEGSALSAGVYFCELHVQGEARQQMAVIRMIIK